MQKFKLLTLTAAIMSIGCTASTSVLAAGGSGQLEEVIVTAEKVKANAQKTAISMQVISGETLKEEAKKSLVDILDDATGIMSQTTQTGPQFSIRGSGPRGRPGGESPVAVYVDGVYNNNTTTLRGAMLDVSQVEVLKGPQGTLYGRNAMAGAVNVTTNQPVFKTEGNASIDIGNYGRVATDGVFNTAISDTQAIRFAFTTEKHDGYYTNGSSDADDITARLKYRFKPSEKLNIILTAEHSFSGGKGTGQFDTPVDWPSRANLHPWVSTDFLPASQRTETDSLHADIEWETDIGTVTFIPVVSDAKFKSLRNVGGGAQVESVPKHAESYELRLSSPASNKLLWQVGLNHSYQDVPRTFWNIDGTGAIAPGPYEVWKENSITSNSAFGQLTVPVTDVIRLTAGLRKNMDSKTANVSYDGNNSSLRAIRTVDYDKLTYVLGAQWDITPTSMLYLTKSTGYQSGNVNFAGSTNTIDATSPQLLDQIALGYKSRHLDNRLQLNTEIYQSKYSNYAVEGGLGSIDPTGDDICPGGPVCIDPSNTNRSETNGTLSNVVIRGIDFDAAFQLTNNDRLSGNLAYLDAKIGAQSAYAGTFANDSLVITNPTSPYMGMTVAQYFTSTLAGFGNKILQRSPKWVLNLNYSHRFDLASGASISVRANTKFSTGYYGALGPGVDAGINSPLFYQPNYHMTNLYTSYDSADGKYTVSAYVKNVENYALVNNVNPNPPIPGMAFATLNLADPRTYGVSFQMRF